MSFNGEQFEFFKPKNQKIQSSYGEQNKRTTRPWRQNLNMNHVIRKKLTDANLKKAFRMKLFELCKTRNKKSSPDLIKFYVISAGHGISMTMTGLPRAGGISKLRDYKQNVQKMTNLLKKWASTGNSLNFSKTKKPKNPVIVWRTKQKNHKTLEAKPEHEPCNQEEINWSKLEKSIQNKTVWTLQD